MSTLKLFIVSTCVPTSPEPCWPEPFLTLAAAEAHMDRMMRDEWGANTPEDPDTCEPLPYPATGWRDAQDTLIARMGDEWGQWQITEHALEIVPAEGEAA